MKWINYMNPDQGPCFPPNMGGDAEYLFQDLNSDGRVPEIPICTGHLQRLMVSVMRGQCEKAGVELLIDEEGIASIDQEVNQAWEAESLAWEAQQRDSGKGQSLLA